MDVLEITVKNELFGDCGEEATADAVGSRFVEPDQEDHPIACTGLNSSHGVAAVLEGGAVATELGGLPVDALFVVDDDADDVVDEALLPDFFRSPRDFFVTPSVFFPLDPLV